MSSGPLRSLAELLAWSAAGAAPCEKTPLALVGIVKQIVISTSPLRV